MGEYQKYLAELIGTFVLVFFGCGAAVIAGSSLGVLGIAAAFGLAVLVMVYAIGPISGCHINPARSLGPALLVGGTALAQLWMFIIAPLIGASLAALVWKHLFRDGVTAG
jgi:aquaporin Z